MSLADPKKLRETVQRGSLDSAEEAELEAYLAQHPEQRPDWEEELALSHLMRQLRDAPLASNFTVRVLEAARMPSQAAFGSWVAWRQFLRLGWVPRVAAVSAALLLSLLGYHHYQVLARKQAAETVAEVLRSGTTLEMLQNFEVIDRLNQVPRDPDKDLIAALQ
jgi:hypothetical protein